MSLQNDINCVSTYIKKCQNEGSQPAMDYMSAFERIVSSLYTNQQDEDEKITIEGEVCVQPGKISAEHVFIAEIPIMEVLSRMFTPDKEHGRWGITIEKLGD